MSNGTASNCQTEDLIIGGSLPFRFSCGFSVLEPQTKRGTEGFCVSGPAGTYHRISCSISATVSCMRPSLEERLVPSRDSIFRSR